MLKNGVKYILFDFRQINHHELKFLTNFEVVLRMIYSRHTDQAKGMILEKILNGVTCKSRFGDYLLTRPSLIVIEKPDYSGLESEFSIYETRYVSRFEEVADEAAKKLKEIPFTRRVSIPLWRPEDHLSSTPVSITELSFLYVDKKLHLTAYIRSLECLNYFESNIDFLCYALERISSATQLEPGSLAVLVGVPHIYLRDIKRAEKEVIHGREEYGYRKLATHIVDDYISSAWHSALDIIYNSGSSKETEWGELFEGQKESLFVHRLFIEVNNPWENRIHDKAPFSESYGIEYTHDYIVYASKLDGRVNEPILKEGEEYSYAERARFCDRDEVRVDQLYEVIEKLKKDTCRRDCYVGISRPWDISSDEPPCLRGYQFLKADRFHGVFYMRSNDAYGAMHANMYAFALLTKYVSELTGFGGDFRYCHFVVDAHVYSEFMEAVRDILYPSGPVMQSL
jgi:thymidylate synthase